MDKTKEKLLVELLAGLKPGFLPYDVFVQIARLVALPIIEFVPLRINGTGKVEILLLHRGKDDPIWPDAWHVPGTVIRATDNEGKIYMAFDRILKDELGGTETGDPYYVGSILHKSKRGTEQAQVFWVEILGEPNEGKFYSADKLPNSLIKSQISFISKAIDSFKEFKTLVL